MSLEVVQLPQRDTSVHGRRYTEEERAGWYLYWRTIAGRSCRKVAQRFNLDERTVRSTRDADDWINRANDDDQDDYASSRLGVAAIVVNELVPSIETARQIRDDPTNAARDRLAAAQWIAGLAGVSPVSKVEQSVTDARVVDVAQPPDFERMSIDELCAYDQQQRRQSRVTERLGANVVATRSARARDA